MKAEMKEDLKELGHAWYDYFAAHKGLSWFLIGAVSGLLACWLF